MLETLSILLFNIYTEHQRCAAWRIYDGGCCILELSHSNDSSNCSLNGRLWHVGGFVVAHFKIKNLCLPRWLIWSGSGRTGMVGAYTESAYACGRNGFGRRGRGGGIAGPCQFAVSPFPDALRQVAIIGRWTRTPAKSRRYWNHGTSSRASTIPGDDDAGSQQLADTRRDFVSLMSGHLDCRVVRRRG